MQKDWRGLQRAPDQGLKILSAPLISAPDVILPTPLEPEIYKDIPSLSAMPPMYQSYWLNFGQNQHSADFGDLPQDLSDDFWCVNAPFNI